ncbi:MAG: hypothetical protein HYZ28_16265 [Myxococcales bacterium]|nr:hypothetical protein [Myxococcales bacterium]
MRRGPTVGAALAAALCCAEAAAAPGSLFDDFESGDLTRWSGGWQPAPSNSLSASKAAAHRGSFGLRLVDADGSSGAGGQNNLEHTVNALTGRYRARFWLRLSSSNGQGMATIAKVLSDQGQAVADVKLRFPGGAVLLAGTDLGSGYLEEATASRLALGQWHLLELELQGVGTSAGQRQLYVDGVLQATTGSRNWNGWSITKFNLGEPWSDAREFQGTIDFDDVRAGPESHPSRLALAGASEVAVGQCVPLAVQLRSSFGAQVAPPGISLEVLLAATGAELSFHAEASCSQPISTVTIGPGETSASAFALPQSTGPARLEARHPDLLPDSFSLSVLAPVAAVSPPEQEISSGEIATLDASASRPSTGHLITAYLWRLRQGPTGVRLSAEAKQSLALEVPGDYRFELAVQDSLGGFSAPVTARVKVAGEVFHPREQLQGCGATAGAPLASLLSLLALPLRRQLRRAASRCFRNSRLR